MQLQQLSMFGFAPDFIEIRGQDAKRDFDHTTWFAAIGGLWQPEPVTPPQPEQQDPDWTV